jgi:hypothetical protein
LASLYRRRKVHSLFIEFFAEKLGSKKRTHYNNNRSSTLITYKDPNIRGESLYISASVLSVDFSEKSYTINFIMQPNGTLADEFGQLKYVQ